MHIGGDRDSFPHGGLGSGNKARNSEAPLEDAPSVFTPTSEWPERAIPSCAASDGTEYYGNFHEFHANATDMKFFYKNDDSLFRSCSIGPDGTIYATVANYSSGGWLRAYAPSGQLKWTAPVAGVGEPPFTSPAISKTGNLYMTARPSDGRPYFLVAVDDTGTERWRRRPDSWILWPTA